MMYNAFFWPIDIYASIHSEHHTYFWNGCHLIPSCIYILWKFCHTSLCSIEENHLPFDREKEMTLISP